MLHIVNKSRRARFFGLLLASLLITNCFSTTHPPVPHRRVKQREAGILLSIYFYKKTQPVELPEMAPLTIGKIIKSGFASLSSEEQKVVQFFLQEENTSLGRLARYSDNPKEVRAAKSSQEQLTPLFKKIKQRAQQHQERFLALRSALSATVAGVGGQLASSLFNFNPDSLSDALIISLSESLLTKMTDDLVRNEGDFKKMCDELYSKATARRLLRVALKTAALHKLNSFTSSRAGQRTVDLRSRSGPLFRFKDHLVRNIVDETIEYSLDVMERLIENKSGEQLKEVLTRELQLKRRLSGIAINTTGAFLMSSWAHRHEKKRQRKERLSPLEKRKSQFLYRAGQFIIAGLGSACRRLVETITHQGLEGLRRLGASLTDDLMSSFFIGGSCAVVAQNISETAYQVRNRTRALNRRTASRTQEEELLTTLWKEKRSINQAKALGKIAGLVTAYALGDLPSGRVGSNLVLEQDFSAIHRQRSETHYLQKREQLAQKRVKSQLQRAYQRGDFKTIADYYIKRGWIIQTKKDTHGSCYYLLSLVDGKGNKLLFPYRDKALAAENFMLFAPKEGFKIKREHHRYLEKHYSREMKKLKPEHREAYLLRRAVKISRRRKEAVAAKDLIAHKILLMEIDFLEQKEKERRKSRLFSSETEKLLYATKVKIHEFIANQEEVDNQRQLMETEEALDRFTSLKKISKEDKIAIYYQLKKCQQVRQRAEKKLNKYLLIAGLNEQLEDFLEPLTVESRLQQEIDASYEKIKRLRALLGRKETTPEPPTVTQKVVQGLRGGKENIGDTFFATAQLLCEGSKYLMDTQFFHLRICLHAYEVYKSTPPNATKEEITQIAKKVLKQDPLVKKNEKIALCIKAVAQAVYRSLQEKLELSSNHLERHADSRRRADLTSLGLHMQDSKLWGQYRNKEELEAAQKVGYWTTEAILLLFGEEMIKGFVEVARAGRAVVLGDRLGRLRLSVKEMKQLLHVANLPKRKKAKALSRFLAQHRELQKIILEERHLAQQLLKKRSSRVKGRWVRTRERMSREAARYQEKITGKPAYMSYQIDYVGKRGVSAALKFDGFKDGVLLEAKSGYGKFINDKTGMFYGWFQKEEELIKQALRQQLAARGLPIVWHVENETLAKLLKKKFKDRKLSITVKHTPAI